MNLLTADHVSPLHEACLGGHSACASVLLKHGAHVSINKCLSFWFIQKFILSKTAQKLFSLSHLIHLVQELSKVQYN